MTEDFETPKGCLWHIFLKIVFQTHKTVGSDTFICLEMTSMILNLFFLDFEINVDTFTHKNILINETITVFTNILKNRSFKDLAL